MGRKAQTLSIVQNINKHIKPKTQLSTLTSNSSIFEKQKRTKISQSITIKKVRKTIINKKCIKLKSLRKQIN